MDKYFKQISINEYEYYPENKKYYTVTKNRFNLNVYNEDCVDEKEITTLKGKLKTQSGKVECDLRFLTKKGVDSMPTWKAYDYRKTVAGKFQFISGRHAQFTQNATSNNAMLLDLVKENYLWINKFQAEKLDIKYGDLVEVASSAGKVQIKAYPTNKIIKDTLFYVHGFGATSDGLILAQRNGASDNAIIEDTIEPVFGSAAMHETQVTVRKV